MRPGDDIMKRLKRLESEVARLSRSPRLPYSSQQGGSNTLLAPDGSVLFEFGDFSDVEDVDRYGVALYDGSGNVVLSVDEDALGIVWPPVTAGWGAITPESVTSVAFIDQWSCQILGFNGDVVYSQAAINTDVGTAGEIRIRVTGSNLGVPFDSYSNVVAIPSGGNGNWFFKWLHNLDIGQPESESFPGTTRFAIETRRTSGAGNVYVYRPRMLTIGSSRYITGAGALGASLSFA